VAKEKVSMEASSPRSTFAAASQGNVENNETLQFPGGIFPTWPLHLPLAVSQIAHTVAACMLFECVSTAQK